MVRNSGPGLDSFGGGRFDWVSWDPRGTHASSPVDCFGSEAAAATFWKGVRTPGNATDAMAYTERTTEVARRCGEVMGPLLSHISTTDTVRDMNRIRELLGEGKITYVGLS